jgi:hypothetical protein
MSYHLAIAGFEMFIPEGRISIDDIVNDVQTDPIPGVGPKASYSDFLAKTMGLKEISQSNQACHEMMENVLDIFIKQGAISAEEVDVLVILQESSNLVPENFGQQLIHRFGLKNAYSINIGGNHCANIEAVMPILLRTPVNNILMIGGMKETGLSKRIYGGFGIVGDGAGLIWLSHKKRLAELNSYGHNVNPALHRGQTGDSPVIENFKLYTELLDELKAREPEQYAAVKKIIIQNANPLLPTQIVGMKGLDKQAIFKDNLGRYGHLGVVDSIINLRDVIMNSGLVSGDKIMSLSTGLYGSLVANIFEIV